ncbi:hypothetical protein Ancab_017879 [Ancistrocladus abbreviatus]
MRMDRFVIKIKAGVYREKVEIHRNKVHIMLVGDGMSSTVITGSRGFNDGYFTLDSAILRHLLDFYTDSLYQFYRECTIQGTIDFIFRNAATIFQNYLVRKLSHGQSNVITTQGREDRNQNFGISMQNYTIKAALDFGLADRDTLPPI